MKKKKEEKIREAELEITFGRKPVWKVARENTDEANFLEQTVKRCARCARRAFWTYRVIFLMKGGIISILSAKCDSGNLVNTLSDL